MKHYVINIKEENKSLGVVATQIADILRGKNTPQFRPNVIPEVQVLVKNASDLGLSEKKLADQYVHYTGHPGGLHRNSRSKIIEKKGYAEVLRRAVYGMLPKNKLRSQLIKNLLIEE